MKAIGCFVALFVGIGLLPSSQADESPRSPYVDEEKGTQLFFHDWASGSDYVL
jgi:hypothetical protein